MKKFIPYILIIILGFFIYNLYTKLQDEKQIYYQNNVALNDSLNNINSSWSKRFAIVTDLSNKKDSLLNDRDEEILNQQSLIISLKTINDSGTGIVIHDTTAIIDSNYLGQLFLFKSKTSFYSYEINVWFNEVPKYNFKQVFNPFSLDVYLTRNKDKLWSGYVKIGDNAKKYLRVSKLNVFVERDEYLRTEKEPTRIDIGLGGNVLLAPQVFLGLGLNVLFNTKNEYGYTYYLGKSYHEISYRRFFNIKK